MGTRTVTPTSEAIEARLDVLERIACQLGVGLAGIGGSGIWKRSPDLRELVQAKQAADGAAVKVGG